MLYSNKMLSAVHAADVLYMLCYLYFVAGTSGSVCVQPSNLTLSSPQGMQHIPHFSLCIFQACLSSMVLWSKGSLFHVSCHPGEALTVKVTTD